MARGSLRPSRSSASGRRQNKPLQRHFGSIGKQNLSAVVKPHRVDHVQRKDLDAQLARVLEASNARLNSRAGRKALVKSWLPVAWVVQQERAEAALPVRIARWPRPQKQEQTSRNMVEAYQETPPHDTMDPFRRVSPARAAAAFKEGGERLVRVITRLINRTRVRRGSRLSPGKKQRLCKNYSAAHVMPMYELAITIKPNAMRYQANGVKSCVIT